MQAQPYATKADGTITPEDRDGIVNSLAEGGIVCLPTETCYGLAARADLAQSMAHLAELKGRPEERAFTWHVGPATEAGQGLPWEAMRQRLAEAYWPGPLTLVAPAPTAWAEARGVSAICREGRVGFRVPAHPATAAILDAAPFPIVMTSANRSGETPLVEASAVVAAFGEQISACLDAGTTELGGSSTVLALGPGQMEILRQGQLSLEDLRAKVGLRILFVCTGNTCRSPMAEAIAKHLLTEELGVQENRLRDFGFSVSSAGVFASPGAPASRESVSAVREIGLDLDAHGSTPIGQALSQGIERIYCLSHSHIAALLDAPFEGPMPVPELLDPSGVSIPDPIGGPIEVYRQTRDAIAAAIQKRLSEWV